MGIQKQEVCLKKLQKLIPKNKELAQEFNVLEGIICDILKESEKWLALKLESYEASLKNQIKLNFSQVEEALKLLEAASTSLEDLDDIRKNLQNIHIDYSPNNIFNVNETELYWKMKPNFASQKQSKEHVTVALCCNASGTGKIKEVFIRKSQNSRVLKHISKSSLPIQYY
ncbi:8978_t:CDS:2 [Funneliformis caledonium]|uniref:8978_t:CDS:1 n=1 Tax=Funneliformis caledonium TaxID=1117310 RepID=A0A9N8YTQ2_9GLOM|nr:8978_t:CDS:2 [Funneliformis caledonium]